MTWIVNYITGCALLLVIGPAGAQQGIRYLYEPVVKAAVMETWAYPVDFRDSTAYDTLYERLSAEGMPVSYHRRINTAVCFDGKCRLLDITLHWNPTGTYLGFELPEKEFLSKTDHDPFSRAEYVRLHEILSDSLSPLNDYTFAELVPGTGDPMETDAVSSATLKEITNYIVPGAAYTTYRLWHLVYGAAPAEISARSTARLNAAMALQILKNGNTADRIWALNRVQKLEPWTSELLEEIFSLLYSGNLNLSERAIAAIGPQTVNLPEVQKRMLHAFGEAPYGLKKMLINQLRKAETIDRGVLAGFAEILPEMNGDLIRAVLDLYWEKGVRDPGILGKVSLLLEQPNRFVAGKVYEFLEKTAPAEGAVLKRMDAYRRGNP